MHLLLEYPQSLPFFQMYTGGTGDRGERDHISYTHERHMHFLPITWLGTQDRLHARQFCSAVELYLSPSKTGWNSN